MKLREAIGLGLCLGILVLVEATALSVLLGGVHHATIMQSDAGGFWLFAEYAVIFSAFAMLGWALSWPISRRFGDLAGECVLLLVLALPIVNAALVTRPPLANALQSTPALVLIALAILGLVFAVSHTRDLARRKSRLALLSLLVCGIPCGAALVSLNLLQLTSELLSVSGLLTLSLLLPTTSALALPMMWALRGQAALPSLKRMGMVAAGYTVLFGAEVFILPFASASGWNPDGDPLSDGGRERPPVLLIVVDTLRADHVAGFGAADDLTPHIRALARDGVSFTRAYSTAPWTTPSFASILTSKFPKQHQAGRRDQSLGFKYPLSESVATLPALMAENGYWTGAVVSNTYIGPRYGLDRGFFVYENFLATEWSHPVLVGVRSFSPKVFELPSYVTGRTQTRRITGLLDRAASSRRPFFVMVHYMDPHAPYHPLPGDDAMEPSTAADRYRAEVAYVDEQLGALMDELKRIGLYSRLLIVLTADHGEQLLERRDAGGHDHGHTLFDELLAIPLIIKLPGDHAGGVVRSELVSQIDIAPTVLGVVGIDPEERFVGVDLFATENNLQADRIIFAEGLHYGVEKKAAIQGQLKVILHALPPSPEAARGYDLATDPGENRPIDVSSAEFAPLYEKLVEFSESEESLPLGAPVHVDSLQRSQLEALGYLE